MSKGGTTTFVNGEPTRKFKSRPSLSSLVNVSFKLTGGTVYSLEALRAGVKKAEKMLFKGMPSGGYAEVVCPMTSPNKSCVWTIRLDGDNLELVFVSEKNPYPHRKISVIASIENDGVIASEEETSTRAVLTLLRYIERLEERNAPDGSYAIEVGNAYTPYDSFYFNITKVDSNVYVIKSARPFELHTRIKEAVNTGGTKESGKTQGGGSVIPSGYR